MKISSGGMDVMESGKVLSNRMNDVVLYLLDSPEATVTVKVEVDESGSSAILKIPSSNDVKFVFKNPSITRMGTIDPTEIGESGGKKLYALIRISTHGTPVSSFEVTYTFYVER